MEVASGKATVGKAGDGEAVDREAVAWEAVDREAGDVKATTVKVADGEAAEGAAEDVSTADVKVAVSKVAVSKIAVVKAAATNPAATRAADGTAAAGAPPCCVGGRGRPRARRPAAPAARGGRPKTRGVARPRGTHGAGVTLLEALLALLLFALAAAGCLVASRTLQRAQRTLEERGGELQAQAAAAELLRAELAPAGFGGDAADSIPDAALTLLATPHGHAIAFELVESTPGGRRRRELRLEAGRDRHGRPALYRARDAAPRQPLVAGVSALRVTGLVHADGLLPLPAAAHPAGATAGGAPPAAGARPQTDPGTDPGTDPASDQGTRRGIDSGSGGASGRWSGVWALALELEYAWGARQRLLVALRAPQEVRLAPE